MINGCSLEHNLLVNIVIKIPDFSAAAETDIL